MGCPKRCRGYRRRPLGGRLAGHGAVRRGARGAARAGRRASTARRGGGAGIAWRDRSGLARRCRRAPRRGGLCHRGGGPAALCGGGRACRRARGGAPSTHRRRAGGAHRGGSVRAALRAGRGGAASRDSRHGRAHRGERLPRLVGAAHPSGCGRTHLGRAVVRPRRRVAAPHASRVLRRRAQRSLLRAGRQPVRRRGIVSPVHGLALPRTHRSACGYRAHRPRCVRCCLLYTSRCV